MTFTDERPAWQSRGACRGLDPDVFYPARGENAPDAKGVCRGCPVRQECLDYAIDNFEDFGIWGGTTERERQRLRRARGLRSRQCPWCRQQFAPASGGQLYCAPAHAEAARTARKSQRVG